MGLDFDTSRLGGNWWSTHEGIIAAAGIMVRNLNAYNQILMFCITTGQGIGYGGSFLDLLRRLLPFIRFDDDGEGQRNALLAAFERISSSYVGQVSEGREDVDSIKGKVLAGLCEQLTRALLDKEAPRDRVVPDAWAFDGPNRILPDNSASLDFAAAKLIYRDWYWEVFECKQSPSTFLEPYAWQADPDPTRRLNWIRSQVRLALAILFVGKTFAAVTVVSYKSRPEVEAGLRRLKQMPKEIGVYCREDAWKKIPWCQLGG